MRQSIVHVALVVRDYDEPKQAPYGSVAVFEDLYGSLRDLVELVSPAPAGGASVGP